MDGSEGGRVLILRILVVMVSITIGVSLLAYLVSGERPYLLFAFQVFKYSLYFSLLLLVLMALERLIPALL
jgi:hypothetical protein